MVRALEPRERLDEHVESFLWGESADAQHVGSRVREACVVGELGGVVAVEHHDAGERPRPGRILERAECGLEDRPRFAPHEAVCPVRERDRTLRVLGKREAGDAKGGRLLLHATAIREDEPRDRSAVKEIRGTPAGGAW